jgi:hypothetical protein
MADETETEIAEAEAVKAEPEAKAEAPAKVADVKPEADEEEAPAKKPKLIVMDDDISKAERDPKAEAKADAIFAKAGETILVLSHPDGATCGQYETDKKGRTLCPASEAAILIEQGFVVDDGK